MNKIECFKTELNYIKDKRLKKVLKINNMLPDYFYYPS